MPGFGLYTGMIKPQSLNILGANHRLVISGTKHGEKRDWKIYNSFRLVQIKRQKTTEI